MIAWLKLDAHCPEYSKIVSDDIDEIIQWRFGDDEPSDKEDREFRIWLTTAPFGIVRAIPGKKGYSIVRVTFNDDVTLPEPKAAATNESESASSQDAS